MATITDTFSSRSDTAAGAMGFPSDFTPTNLISNPGFETDLTGWTPTGTGLTATRDTGTKHSGAASMKLVETAAGATAYGNFIVSGLAASTRYVVSGWRNCTVFTAGASSNLDLYTFDLDNVAGTQQFTALFATSGGFVEQILEVTTTATAGTHQIYIDAFAPQGTVFWDDFKLAPAVYKVAGNATVPSAFVGQISGGKFVTAASNTSYASRSIGAGLKVSSFRGVFSFANNTNDAGGAIMLFGSDFPNSNAASINLAGHLLMNKTGWAYSVYQAGAGTVLGQAAWKTGLAQSTSYTVQIDVFGNTAVLTLPDGTVNVCYDSRMSGLNGEYATLELVSTQANDTAYRWESMTASDVTVGGEPGKRMLLGVGA